MSEAKVKIISWPDIVSIILALCRAAVQMSPEMMWNISNTNFIFMWNYSNAAVQHELPEPNQILRSIPSSECSLDNKVLFCESVQYIKVDSLGQCVRYNTLIWAISISEAGTIKLVCCISNFFLNTWFMHSSDAECRWYGGCGCYINNGLHQHSNLILLNQTNVAQWKGRNKCLGWLKGMNFNPVC